MNEGSTPAHTAYAIVPEPGRTIRASAAPPTQDLQNYRIAVVALDDSTAAQTLLSAVRDFSLKSNAELEEFTAETSGASGLQSAFSRAVSSQADVVVGLGEDVVDIFTFETAKVLDQQFLVVGAQLAEPTSNVTSVIWRGATSRGSAASPDGDIDERAVTHERGAEALGIGIDSVLKGVTGVVLSLD